MHLILAALLACSPAPDTASDPPAPARLRTAQPRRSIDTGGEPQAAEIEEGLPPDTPCERPPGDVWDRQPANELLSVARALGGVDAATLQSDLEWIRESEPGLSGTRVAGAANVRWVRVRLTPAGQRAWKRGQWPTGDCAGTIAALTDDVELDYRGRLRLHIGGDLPVEPLAAWLETVPGVVEVDWALGGFSQRPAEAPFVEDAVAEAWLDGKERLWVVQAHGLVRGFRSSGGALRSLEPWRAGSPRPAWMPSVGPASRLAPGGGIAPGDEAVDNDAWRELATLDWCAPVDRGVARRPVQVFDHQPALNAHWRQLMRGRQRVEPLPLIDLTRFVVVAVASSSSGPASAAPPVWRGDAILLSKAEFPSHGVGSLAACSCRTTFVAVPRGAATEVRFVQDGTQVGQAPIPE